jgi:hypothetical protein
VTSINLAKTPSFRLDGRRALVTGGGRGIGLAYLASSSNSDSSALAPTSAKQNKALVLEAFATAFAELGSLGASAQRINSCYTKSLIMSKSSKLNWKLFVTPAVTTVSDDMPPGETARAGGSSVWT